MFLATATTYIISLVLNLIYLLIDIKGSKTKATLSDYFLIFTPIVNTVVSISIIIIEALLIVHSVDWKNLFKKK
jgi:hypothetical protein